MPYLYDQLKTRIGAIWILCECKYLMYCTMLTIMSINERVFSRMQNGDLRNNIGEFTLQHEQ